MSLNGKYKQPEQETGAFIGRGKNLMYALNYDWSDLHLSIQVRNLAALPIHHSVASLCYFT
jgi:hypothetical protein